MRNKQWMKRELLPGIQQKQRVVMKVESIYCPCYLGGVNETGVSSLDRPMFAL